MPKQNNRPLKEKNPFDALSAPAKKDTEKLEKDPTVLAKAVFDNFSKALHRELKICHNGNYAVLCIDEALVAVLSPHLRAEIPTTALRNSICEALEKLLSEQKKPNGVKCIVRDTANAMQFRETTFVIVTLNPALDPNKVWSDFDTPGDVQEFGA